MSAKAAILAMVIAPGVCAAGETARPAPVEEWLRRPTAEQMAAYYPDRAQRMEASGRVTLDCRVTPAQELEDCRVTAEAPLDFGFGEQALKVTQFIRLPAPTPVEIEQGLVRRTLTFTFRASAAGL